VSSKQLETRDERLDRLSDSFLDLFEEMVKDKKITGTALGKVLDFFTAHEHRRKAEREAEAAAREQAQANPLSLILVPGIPKQRKLEIMVEHAHELRRAFEEVEKVVQELEQED